MDATTTQEPEAPTTEEEEPLSISKTNLAHALHHYKMARLSLERAGVIVYRMSLNDNGAGAAVGEAWAVHSNAEGELQEASNVIAGVENDRKAHWG